MSRNPHHKILSNPNHCIECGTQIIRRSVVRYGGKCLACHRKERVLIPCPQCGAQRKVARSYAARKESKFTVCGKCAQNHAVSSFGPIVRPVDKPTPSAIRINGCMLIPASKGRSADYYLCPNGFCAPLLDIPKSLECARMAAIKRWDGWTCDKGSKPGRMTPEQVDVANGLLSVGAMQNRDGDRLTA